MKMRSLTMVVVLCLLASAAWSAETSSTVPSSSSNSLGVKGAPNLFSLLSSSKIKWSSSYSVSFFSGGGTSGSMGMLRTSMFYELSPKLSMRFNMGVLHGMSGIYADSRNNATFLPGFTLDYHPSETFRMILDIQKVTGAYYPYDRSLGFWRDPLYPY